VKIKTATMLRTSRVLMRAARILQLLDTVKRGLCDGRTGNRGRC
jgi:hypothetical protein